MHKYGAYLSGIEVGEVERAEKTCTWADRTSHLERPASSCISRADSRTEYQQDRLRSLIYPINETSE